MCSAAHQLHQPCVCHPVHGRPQQPQLSRQHGRKEGASVPNRRGHEWPAGVELSRDWSLPTSPRLLRPRAEPASSLFFSLSLSHHMPLSAEKKSNKGEKQPQELCTKCIKMKDYFFKWLQYYILFLDIEKTNKQKKRWGKTNHFIDVLSVLFNFVHFLFTYSHYLCANVKDGERHGCGADVMFLFSCFFWGGEGVWIVLGGERGSRGVSFHPRGRSCQVFSCSEE